MTKMNRTSGSIFDIRPESLGQQTRVDELGLLIIILKQLPSLISRNRQIMFTQYMKMVNRLAAAVRVWENSESDQSINLEV
jgi:hypothetical protein